MLDGYYYPDIDFLIIQPELHLQSSDSVVVLKFLGAECIEVYVCCIYILTIAIV